MLASAQATAANELHRSAPEKEPLGKNAKSYGKPPQEGQDARRAKWEAQRCLWTHSTLERVKKCRRVPHGSLVSVAVRNDGAAQFGGLTTCASVHACPRCSARIWAARGSELAQALETWAAAGGSFAFITLTMRHHRGQTLPELWDALSPAWAAASTQNRQVRRLRDELGVAGFCRVTEATHGSNGWHLHVHAIAFIEPPSGKTAQQASDELGKAMFAGWSKRLEALGFAAPIADKGGLNASSFSLTQAREKVAKYATKSSYEMAVRKTAFELTGGRLKDGRHGNRTPWAVLRDFVQNGDCADLAIWQAWEAGSHGRRAMTWTHSLKKRLLVEQLTDEEIAADEDQAAVVVAVIPKETWAAVCRQPAAPVSLLEAVEKAGEPVAALLAIWSLLDSWGLPPPLPPP